MPDASEPRIRRRYDPTRIRMGQKRDLTAIEVRKGRRNGEAFRAYVADPDRPGRKLTGPWDTYEQALEWRRRALEIKAEAKQRAQEQRAANTLAQLERSLAERGRST